ncbi:MAG: hypothetical protein HOW73_06715 [Polyangiaceae bacterium]|nr:hypothetical protein [Polyangiaceae bacterium]
MRGGPTSWTAAVAVAFLGACAGASSRTANDDANRVDTVDVKAPAASAEATPTAAPDGRCVDPSDRGLLPKASRCGYVFEKTGPAGHRWLMRVMPLRGRMHLDDLRGHLDSLFPGGYAVRADGIHATRRESEGAEDLALVIDEPVKVGSSHAFHDQGSVVVEEEEQVTVPAGTFDAVRVRVASSRYSNPTTVWLARGVGIVKMNAAGDEHVLAEIVEPGPRGLLPICESKKSGPMEGLPDRFELECSLAGNLLKRGWALLANDKTTSKPVIVLRLVEPHRTAPRDVLYSGTFNDNPYGQGEIWVFDVSTPWIDIARGGWAQ